VEDFFRRVAQRDKTKQVSSVGTKEYLSSVKAKKVKGREERGEKKRSKLRGGVEYDLNVPNKSIEYAAKRVFPVVARRAVRDDLSPPSQRRNGMRACNIACLSTRQKKAADGPSPLKANEQERLQKEHTGSLLRSSHESKAKELGKGGGKAMKSDGK
jgi:hypothetical protein